MIAPHFMQFVKTFKVCVWTQKRRLFTAVTVSRSATAIGRGCALSNRFMTMPHVFRRVINRDIYKTEPH